MEAIAPSRNLATALEELQKLTPDAPFLALGQTIFWDEPMKGGIVLAARRMGYPRRFVAGVHDTDYFAKLGGSRRPIGKYRSLKHNDTTTKGLWSAAAEFSSLFGSETVVTRETLAAAGLKIARLAAIRPDFLDEATEAWGWRGVVSLEDHPPITADTALAPLFSELKAAFDWALRETVQSLSGEARNEAQNLADELEAAFCDAAEGAETLGAFYKALLPKMYAFAAGREVELEPIATTELLRFNSQTAGSPRFDLVRLFFGAESRRIASDAYDEASRHSGRYELARFGVGAIPFDLVIPGLGRGTIRVGKRGIVINTPQPQFLSIPKGTGQPSLETFAGWVEKKFGPNCALVGKAVTLIGMLAREHVFVFHEGASEYVSSSRAMHQRLAERGYPLELNPILRVKYDSWTAMKVACSWINLPEPLQAPFGAEEICAPSFAARWKQVIEEQSRRLEELGRLRRPMDLIRYLEKTSGDVWSALAESYQTAQADLERLRAQIESRRKERAALVQEWEALRTKRAELEKAKGDHFRATIFGKDPNPADLEERQRLTSELDAVLKGLDETRALIRKSIAEQAAFAKSAEAMQAKEARRRLEIEVELKRLRLIRQAVIAGKGLKKASNRPSAWWFNLVSPDGLWFRETIETAECYLEPLR